MSQWILGVHERDEKPSLRRRTLHSHPSYEIFCLLSGDVDYRVEGVVFPLHSGDLILMRKGEVHIPQLKSAAPYERMHVNFDLGPDFPKEQSSFLMSAFHDRPIGRYNCFPATLFPATHWRYYMEQICHASNDACRQAYLTVLLCELARSLPAVKKAAEVSAPDTGEMLVRYLNENLTAPLTLGEIADRFYMSSTHLNRVFRRTTGTTVIRYLTLKRLFLAKERLERGEKAVRVAAACGWRDYTTFFRSYKKEFGTSPKSHQ